MPLDLPFAVGFYVGGELVGTETIAALDAHADRWITLAAPVTNGQVDIRVVADMQNAVPESSENNNQRTLAGLTVDVRLPDLAVQTIQWNGPALRYGEAGQFKVRFTNLGLGESQGAFTLHLEVNGELVAAYRHEEILKSRASGYWFVDWTPDVTGDGVAEVAVTLDTLDEVAELVEDNNRWSVSVQLDPGIVIDLGSHTTLIDVYDAIRESQQVALASSEAITESYLTEDSITFTARVADSQAPDTPLGQPEGVTVQLRLLDSEGTELVATPMAYVASLAAFRYEFNVADAGLPEGTYTAEFEVAVPGQRPLTRYLPFELVADFAVSAATDKTTYATGENVRISGIVERADGLPVADAVLNILLIHNGQQRLFQAATDAQGRYQFLFDPHAGEGGEYSLAVSTIRRGLERAGFAWFDIQGLHVQSDAHMPVPVRQSGANVVTLTLTNLGTVTLDDLTFNLSDEEPNDAVIAVLKAEDAATTLAPEEATEVKVELYALDPSVPGTEQQFFFTVGNALGFNTTFVVETVVVRAEPLLAVDPESVHLGARPGGVAVTQTIAISNAGHAPLTDLVVLPPSLPWLTVSALGTDRLARGASTTVVLTAKPGPAVALNSYRDELGVVSNGGTAIIPIAIEVTEEIVGHLRVIVRNDFDLPVANADVYVSLASSPFEQLADPAIVERSLRLRGRTGADGTVTFADVLAGDYDGEASADFHQSAEGSVYVQPGSAVTDLVLTLELDSFRFSWNCTTSTEQQTLGRAQVDLVMSANVDGAPTLIPNKPAGEYFLRQGDPAGTDYAILFIGGSSASTLAERQSHNLDMFYLVARKLYIALVSYAGLDPRNIYVLCADGDDPSPDRESGKNSDKFSVNWYAATSAEFERVINLVKGKMEAEVAQGKLPHLFVYTEDHGAGLENNASRHDEEVLIGWGPGEIITNDTLAGWLNGLTAGYRTYLFAQCFSGGMLEELTVTDRMFGMAAATHQEVSWGSANSGFPVAFINGLRAGQTSTYGSFQYAFAHDDTAKAGGPNAAWVNAQFSHPWAVGHDFPIFAGSGMLSDSPIAPRDRDMFSLNNPSLDKITGVKVEAVGILGDAIRFGNGKTVLEIGEVPAQGSALFSFVIQKERFADVAEERIYDGGYLRATGNVGERLIETIIPIRIRIGPEGGRFEGQPYRITPFVGPWPTGALQYGESFVAQWFDRHPDLAPSGLSQVGLSQEISVEDELFTVEATFQNILPDIAFEAVRAEVLIATAPVNEAGKLPAGARLVTAEFQGESVASMPTTLLPEQSGTLKMRLKPGPGVGGSSDAGQTYYVHLRVRYQINGIEAVFTTAGRPIVVRPAPELSLRYGVPALGLPLNAGDTFRVNVTVTNSGAGTARNLKINVPDIDLTTALRGPSGVHLVHSSPRGDSVTELAFGDVAPSQTAEGWWEFSVLSPLRVSAFTTSFTAQDGARADVTLGSPLKETLVGKHTRQDLVQALTDLEHAIYAKIDADVDRAAAIVGETAGTVNELEALSKALQANYVFNFAVRSLRLLGTAISFGRASTQYAANEIGRFGYAIKQIGMVTASGSFLSSLFSLFKSTKPDIGQIWSGAFAEALKNPATAATTFRTFLETKFPVYLIRDYAVWNDLSAVVTQDPEALLAQLDVIIKKAENEFYRVEGTQALKDAIKKDLATSLGFLSSALPAYYPIDALYEEYVRLTEALQKATGGLGVPEVNRQTGEPVRQPTAWYSVGEKGAIVVGEWLPVYLTSWEFGTSFEPAYLLGKLLEHQHYQLSLHWELIAMKWQQSMLSSAATAAGLLPFSGVGIAGFLGRTSAMVANWAIDAALQTVQEAEVWGFEWIAKRFADLLHNQEFENSGVWRMSSDIKFHLQYLDERAPVDPAVPLFVESVSIPDIELAPDALSGTGTAHVVVRNDASGPIQVVPVLQIVGGGEDAGRFEGEAALIPAGAAATLTATYAGVKSSLVDLHGYDVRVELLAIDPATMSHVIAGPYPGRFYIGTADELALFHQQRLSYPLAGTLNQGETREATVTLAPGAQRLRVWLTQALDSNFDLHLYDAAGNHVGWDPVAGADAVNIAGAEYGGSAGAAEWIWLDALPGETYRVVVNATEVPLDAEYAVSLLEVPGYPALLDSISPAIDRTTNARSFSALISIVEYGQQRGVESVAVSASDLTDGLGHTLPAANVAFDLASPLIPAGGSADFNALFTLPVSLPDGRYTGTLTIEGIDAVSGAPVSETVPIVIALDTSPPPAPVLDPVASPILEGPATLTGTADPESVVEILLDGEHVEYVVPEPDGSFIHRLVYVPAGDHLLSARAHDAAHNASEASPAVAVVSMVDLTPPTTQLAVEGQQGENGWHVTPVLLDFTAQHEPDGSGAGQTYYSFDGGLNWLVDTGRNDLAAEGQHQLWFYSDDQAGNREAPQFTQIKLDTRAPQSAVGALPDQQASPEFAVVWGPLGSPDLSGIVSYDLYVSDNDAPFQLWLDDTANTAAAFVGQAGHTYQFYSRARDAAGNVEAAPVQPDAVTTVAGGVPFTLDAIVINDGTPQRSRVTRITLEFSAPPALAPGALLLTDQDEQPVPITWSDLAGNGRQWVVTFPTAPSGSLTDGQYQLSVFPTHITGPGQQILAGGIQRLGFHCRFGDADGDGDVDFADLFAFRPVLEANLEAPKADSLTSP
ncbi:MAG: hypothetical protein FJ387_02565 [Verrucomicrobia bacterium]|nr:hypothetical protein [Verrucomicrobiota bacterium]